MNRSIYGLEGAGEWSELQKLLPDFQGKRVLDLGCGYGWHCLYAAQHGAEFVLGIDLSKKMLAVAKQKNKFPQVHYQNCAMEDFEFPANEYDVVISSLAFHYIEDFDGIVNSVFRSLTNGGVFVFSVEHPTFTAYGTQDWYYDKSGKILHFPVNNYYYEGKREAVFLGEKVTKYHRTLTTYLNTLWDHGFQIQRVVEPQAPENRMDQPGMKEEMRRPIMLLVSAKK